MRRRGRITSIERTNFTSCSYITGVNKYGQDYYDNNRSYNGSNGTYTYDYHTEPSITMKITLYETETEPTRWIEMDIRPAILKELGLTRVSAQRLAFIQKNNVGRKIDVEYSQNPEHIAFYDRLIFQ